MGKLIVIEGTDCSGKETQTNCLLEKLSKKYNVIKTSFPMYETSTGKIVGGAYLGKKHIGEAVFKEGAANVDPKVASLYYAADRKYNLPIIEKMIMENDIVLLDRYVESNMAHQAGKINDKNKRKEMYNWLETLEYDLLQLPKPSLTILLYMPYQYALMLKQSRTELPDQHESNKEHLLNAEKAYLELADIYHFHIVNCVKDGQIRTVEDINHEIYLIIDNYLKNNK